MALIETAEVMFADSGVDGVSIRGIGTAIGSANPSIVAYHFGTKERLIEAVYRNRLPTLEARRADLLAEIRAGGGKASRQELLRALWQPLFEQVNDEGKHSYARFLSAVFRKGMAHTRELMNREFPTSLLIVEEILATLEIARAKSLEARLHMMVCMILSSLEYIDLKGLGCSDEAARIFSDALAMADRALDAPCVANASGLRSRGKRRST